MTGSRVVLLRPGVPRFSRRSFGDIGRELGRDPHDVAFDVLLSEIDQLHRPMVIIDAYTQEQQERTFVHPLCMPGSDATTLAPDGPLSGAMFHGAYSWASWYFRFCVREQKVLGLPEAIHRLSGAPAARLGLSDRGVIRVGARRVFAVFDPVAFRTGLRLRPQPARDRHGHGRRERRGHAQRR